MACSVPPDEGLVAIAAVDALESFAQGRQGFGATQVAIFQFDLALIKSLGQ